MELQLAILLWCVEGSAPDGEMIPWELKDCQRAAESWVLSVLLVGLMGLNCFDLCQSALIQTVFQSLGDGRGLPAAPLSEEGLI